MTSNKIISLDQVAEQSDKSKQNGQRVVLCHGTFDLMHTGHIRYLQRAKQEGDILLVTVTADEFVNKGPGRPIFNQQLRAENLAALECVDFVAINYAVSAVDALNKIKPDVYAKGSEYRSHSDDITGNIILEQKAVENHGGDIFYTDEITFSSSSLLNEHFGVFSPETKHFLEQFREKWSEKQVHEFVDSLSELNVLVVGDAIIDQYHYVSPMGQTGKGSALAVRYDNEEQFAGGSIAVANHIAGFANSVTLLSGLGKKKSYEEFIKDKLKQNIDTAFYYFKDAPTVTKRRFVDSDLAKLFEIYFYQDTPTLEDDGREINKWLTGNLDKYDAVVVADFGNGFINDAMIETLCDKSSYLAVNTQINSGNRGYHVINRYARANYVSLNEPELRLAAHNRNDPLEEVGEIVASKVNAKQLAITRGTKGVMMLDRDSRMIHKIPALSSRVIDRIGAGDAFLSLSALSLSKGIDAEVAAFIGSVSAAMDVQIVCNRDAVEPLSLKKYISTLLK
ncbi:MAG: PfkB family carbohydrate kinase [Proteobacteria bacterium]|nr:PfkB family carbohydrate kinase [Pseudomonadota bacterium]